MPISRPKISSTYPKVRYLYWNLGIWKGKLNYFRTSRVSKGRLESFLVRCVVIINFNFVQISNYSMYLFISIK